MSTNERVNVSLFPPERSSPVLSTVMLGIATLIIVGGPILAIGSELSKPKTLSADEELAQYEASLPAVDVQIAARGKRLYEASCIACHGVDGKGVSNLGKDLTAGTSLARTTRDDAKLAALIAKGRGPGDVGFTGPLPMPAKGGRADFSDADVASIVTFVRTLQMPARLTVKELPDVVVEVLDGPATPAKAPAEASQASAALGATDAPVVVTTFDPEVLKRGKKVFANCIACHAANGQGMKGVGADLVHSKFVASHTDAQLHDFIKTGRAPGAPDSVMNLNMPSKGGNPALKDTQIDDVIVYIRSLQANAK
jgi:mono/diheme cytochrome c family protein